jgi:dihydroorotate dehydrogenase (NAD+) catalytic subunit
MGGIMDYKDVLEFFIVGARAVEIGTANFVKPGASLEVVEGLTRYCAERGIRHIGEMVGSLKISKQ